MVLANGEENCKARVSTMTMALVRIHRLEEEDTNQTGTSQQSRICSREDLWEKHQFNPRRAAGSSTSQKVLTLLVLDVARESLHREEDCLKKKKKSKNK